MLNPRLITRVDADMYETRKYAFLKILPKTSPGLRVAEIQERVIACPPEELFPAGAKVGWWAKTVQLDLEAKYVSCARENQADPLASRMTLNRKGAAIVFADESPMNKVSSFEPSVIWRPPVRLNHRLGCCIVLGIALVPAIFASNSARSGAAEMY
jgi:hypothetical protein